MLILVQCSSDSIMTVSYSFSGWGGSTEVQLGFPETEIYGPAIFLILLPSSSPFGSFLKQLLNSHSTLTSEELDLISGSSEDGE